MTDRDKVVRELLDKYYDPGDIGDSLRRAYDAGRAEGYAEGQRAERADVVARVEKLKRHPYGLHDVGWNNALGTMLDGAQHREGEKP